eukprot:1367885-Ditylum_brightwellii.AAC.1
MEIDPESGFMADMDQSDCIIARNTQTEMESSIEWISGCMVGSMYQLAQSQKNNEHGLSQSGSSIKGENQLNKDIANLHLTIKNSLVQLYDTIYKEKKDHEQYLQERLLLLKRNRLSEAEKEGCSVRLVEQQIQ